MTTQPVVQTAWWYKLIPTWAPSWLVELVSGLFAVGGALAAVRLLPAWLAVALLATVISAAYEWKIDPHGWSWTDVLQRECGIALGVVVVKLLSL